MERDHDRCPDAQTLDKGHREHQQELGETDRSQRCGAEPAHQQGVYRVGHSTLKEIAADNRKGQAQHRLAYGGLVVPIREAGLQLCGNVQRSLAKGFSPQARRRRITSVIAARPRTANPA